LQRREEKCSGIFLWRNHWQTRFHPHRGSPPHTAAAIALTVLLFPHTATQNHGIGTVATSWQEFSATLQPKFSAAQRKVLLKQENLKKQSKKMSS
jgi:hypothetical protein